MEYAFEIPRWAGALTWFWRTSVLCFVSDSMMASLDYIRMLCALTDQDVSIM